MHERTIERKMNFRQMAARDADWMFLLFRYRTHCTTRAAASIIYAAMRGTVLAASSRFPLRTPDNAASLVVALLFVVFPQGFARHITGLVIPAEVYLHAK